MPPWWKIRRELTRPFKQLINLPENLATLFFGSIYFDKFKAVEEFEGIAKKSKKAAVFVIFPRTGKVLTSHHRSLRFLNDNGYDITLVSNSQIDSISIEETLPLVRKLFIRPNFGYDFGGYRQGVLDLLESSDDTLERLLLINDSCWFPTLHNSNWLFTAESEDRDLVGLTSNYGISRKWGLTRNSEWEYTHTHKNFHYCSFVLLFSKRVVYSKPFFEFWKKFPLTNKKSRVVRRGEIGLTKLLLRNGFTHGETIKVSTIQSQLKALSESQIREVFSHLIIMDDASLREDYDRISQQEIPERAILEKFLLQSVARQGVPYGLAYYLNTILEVPFLKKSPATANPSTQRQLLRTISILDPDIRDEITQELTRLTNR
jgi:hypothetical protein